jgi:acyl-CoA synthetase (AMP-forming)/AMP-acid ligase II
VLVPVATLPAALRRAAGTWPDEEALVDTAVRLSWRELLDEVRETAGAYLELGVQPGDRVALWAPNTWHWVVAALGAHYAGATLVPLNTRYTGHEALDILQRTNAKLLVATEPFLGVDRLAQLRALSDDLPRTVTIEFARPLRDVLGVHGDPAAADARADAVQPGDVSDILFTSGTTGRSKGVLSAHRQVLAVASAWAECGELAAADRYLVINPFFHSFGYKAGIVACLLTGATIVPQAVYDVPTAMRLVQDERITVLPGAPTIFQTVLDSPDRSSYDLSTLRLAVTGAAVVPVALVERMQSELSLDLVLTAFGMTEAVVVTMCRRGDAPDVVARTCGRAVAGCEIRIGERDELLVRGPNVMLGYLDDPDATSQAIDAEGWLHTGDVGAIDDDGYLRITDRLKDMYISGGFNVYPAEVEQALMRLDGVADAAVIGVPDQRLGEVGLALVVRAGELAEDDVIAFCRERVANYKVPRAVRFVDALPRNLAGKLLKTELRKEYT